MKTTKDIIAAYLSLLLERNRNLKALSEVLDEEFKFKGPLKEFSNREEYLDELARDFWPITALEVKRVFEDGDEVCVIYDIESPDQRLGTLSICDWFTLTKGRISSIQSNFNAQKFAESMSQI